MLQIYNTLTRKKEVFKPKNHDKVSVYFCWPTPYNFAHIGNLKTYVFEDIVVRTLRFLWYGITTTMNITDIDDKTIRDSQKSWESLLAFTQKYTKIFFDDMQKLWNIPADNIAPISWLIPEMVHIINTLLKKQYAYLADDGSIYFSVSKFKKYWALANLDFSWMKSSVRINNDEYEKENVGDFVLWKAYDVTRDGENFWDGKFLVEWQEKILPWRPGWHIECSACNMKFFWPEIDLHMWWVDLIFPHHQNEIAQTEACTGKKFSRYWMHSWHLMIEWKKMSKSLWNFYTLRDIEKHFSNIASWVLYRSVRFSFISWKYRDTLDFSFHKLEQSINAVQKIDETIKKLYRALQTAKNWKVQPTIREKLQEIIQRYIENLEDDINTPEVLSIFFEFQTFVNSELSRGENSKEEVQSFIDMFRTFNQVLGIVDFSHKEEESIPEEIVKMLEERNAAKQNKDFVLADEKRRQIEESWYRVVDDRSGVRVEKI